GPGVPGAGPVAHAGVDRRGIHQGVIRLDANAPRKRLGHCQGVEPVGAGALQCDAVVAESAIPALCRARSPRRFPGWPPGPAPSIELRQGETPPVELTPGRNFALEADAKGDPRRTAEAGDI